MDVFTKEVRSRVMSRVKARDTAPEMIVRRMAHGAGYRYRLHVSALPGSPDLVFPRYRSVIFVNGCFWHGHDCKRGTLPASNVDFWETKIEATRKRDERAGVELAQRGWRVMTLWECELEDRGALESRIARFLSNDEGAEHD